MADLDGRVTLVTGASAPNGIGRAICLVLAGAGARIVATDIGGAAEYEGRIQDRAALLEGLAEAIRAAGGDAMARVLDVTQGAQIAACLAEVQARFGAVDVLVNNAGSLAGAGPFLEGSAEGWQQSFAVNLLGPMLLSQAVIPQMQARGGGVIVNIGSVGGLGGRAGFGAYSAMKHGLTGLTKTIAAEFGPDKTSGAMPFAPAISPPTCMRRRTRGWRPLRALRCPR